jgi:hypothetical protein
MSFLRAFCNLQTKHKGKENKMAETILTHAAKTVLATDPLRAKYDQTMKQLLAEKPILALIIKYTVSECMDMSVPEIVNCIEGTKVVNPSLLSRGFQIVLS